ncbi:MAG TPA: acetyl-CoA carboxylase biotin carboxyl carrier protein [Longimicrobiales bacterium]|nr:acetyl-CoA carboxylase biotin carboxyl carrier protein [Longimicrobiales bacterium]
MAKGEPGRESRTPTAGMNGVAQNMTDLEFLRGLIEAVDQSGIDSLEINRAGTRIRIAKTPAAAPGGPATAPPPAATAHPHIHAVPAAAPPTAAAAAPPTEAVGAPAPAKSGLVDVKSPMVGTFYRAPAPDAPPYVEPGTAVSKGQTLCILEAMKLMNELESEVDGIVREVLVEDADPVEFGQVLFRVEPSASK